MSSLYTQMMDAVTELQQQQRIKPGGVMVVNSLSNAVQSPPLEQAVRRVENEISILSESLEALYNRLSPYMTQVNLAAAAPSHPPSPIVGTSPAVTKLSEITERLTMLNIALTSVKERLEL